MRLLRLLVLLSVISTLTYAQRGGMRGGGGGFMGGGGGFRSGFVGGGGFRSGFVSPGFRGNFGFVNRPFFFPRNQFFFPRNRFFFPRNQFFFPRNRFSFAASFGLPFPSYGYPFYPYVDAGYPAYPPAQFDYGYSRSPQVVTYQSDPAPPVTPYAPQETIRPEVREYPGTSSQTDDKTIYLIAFKNQDNIRAAEAYWVVGASLHFVTLQDEQLVAPLNSVDRTLTYRLNRERRVDFRLPAAP